MNKTELTKLVLDAILSRKDKHNKTTQLAMAINGTYVEDTAYDDGKLQYVWSADGKQLHVEYATITDIVSKINSNATASVNLFLTEKQANKFNIVVGYTGVSILKDDDLNSELIKMVESIGVDVTGLTVAIEFVIGELDNNTKFTYNGVEYTLLPAEEEPDVPTFPALNIISTNGELLITETFFTLGDTFTFVFNEVTGVSQYLPQIAFLTEEQHSKLSVRAIDTSNTASLEDLLELQSYFVQDVSVLLDAPFEIPQNAAYCLMLDMFAELAFSLDEYLSYLFIITYDNVDYVYSLGNGKIIANMTFAPEEPTAPVFNCTNRDGETVTVSTFQLGDNCVCNESVLTPELIFLTSEQYNNLQISTTVASGVDPSFAESLSAYTTPSSISVLTDPGFQVPQDAAYVVPFAELMSMIPDALESVTFTYDGTNYVYTIDKITTATTEQLGE